MIEVTEEYLKGIGNGKIRHKYYKVTESHAEDMEVHVEGKKPRKLLEINRPNEDEETRKYRLEVYEPPTTSLSEKVINTVNKVFNPRLYSIMYPEMSTEDSLEKYLTTELPVYRSLMNFITETFTPKDFADPNGAVIIQPENLDIPETERFEPIPIIVGAKELVDFDDEKYFTFYFKGAHPRDSKIKIYDKVGIYKYGKKGDKWVLEEEYIHNFGFVPVFRNGGIVKGLKYPYFFKSWMAGVLPHWNQVITLSSDLHASYVNHLFQHRWEFETDCDNAACSNGTVEIKGEPISIDGQMSEAEVTYGTCTTCNGSGKVSRGPYGVYTINRDAINPDAPLPTPPLGYVSPDISVVDKVESRIDKEEKKGLASINMEIVQMVGEDQSGVAKTVDREDLNSFVLRYARHVFQYVLPKTIKGIARWRYGTEERDIEQILPKISEPNDVNVLTLNQMTQEYKDASNANVSDNYLINAERELIDSKFANDEMSRLKNESLLMLNPYPGKSVDDYLTLQNLGEPEWKIYMAINLIRLVEKTIENDSEFLSKPMKDKREAVESLAKLESGFSEQIEVIPTQDLSGEDISKAGGVDTIDAEAEAKARLKGSVGGVQGILSIQQSVSSGITQRDAAITLLSEIYGFDEKTASELLGDPIKLPATDSLES